MPMLDSIDTNKKLRIILKESIPTNNFQHNRELESFKTNTIYQLNCPTYPSIWRYYHIKRLEDKSGFGLILFYVSYYIFIPSLMLLSQEYRYTFDQ